MNLREKTCRDCAGTGQKKAKEVTEQGEVKDVEYRCSTCEGQGKYFLTV